MSPTPLPTPTSSRDRVLGLLRASAVPLGVADLMDATGLSANTVRFHLTHLLDGGAIRAARDPSHSGPGRPASLYSAVPAEAVEEASAYRALAGLLATELVRSGRPNAAMDAGRSWASQIIPSIRPAHPVRGSGRPTNPMAVVLNLFEDTGFQPVLAEDGRTVELHRCPFLDLATQQPEVVCGVHLGLLRGVLDEFSASTKVKLVPVLDGSGPCLVRLGSDPQQLTERVSSPSIQERVS